VGRTDVPVDARRAKRLAHRVRRLARREGLPREAWTSPLARSRAVGRWLRRWGWRHHVDERLSELHFGRWEGERWNRIAPADVAAWEAAFADHAPGGGESLRALLARVQSFIAQHRGRGPVLVVGHAGWMQALQCSLRGDVPDAAHWPAPPRHGELLRIDLP
jgi:alpha-ribazole phosphatase